MFKRFQEIPFQFFLNNNNNKSRSFGPSNVSKPHCHLKGRKLSDSKRIRKLWTPGPHISDVLFSQKIK